MRKLSSFVLGAALCGIVLAPSSAAARARGIATTTCDSCHGGRGAAELSLSGSPATFEPGEHVTFTLAIRAATIKVGGTYLSSNGVGTLTPISGEGLVAATDALMHDMPKAANDGEVTFRFDWQAPAKPGAVTFVVAGLAGNGDGRSSQGDAAGYREFQFVFGCEGREYYRDSDRDGYGTDELPTVLGCADSAPDQLAPVAGDCDDYNEALHPDAGELCNGKDDNCDGQIDEGLDAVMLWPDADGDGFYASQSGTPKLGCVGLKGYAAQPGDCAPNDANVHPGAAEVCNERDDNCDGRVDERVRPQCGVGWCRRDSVTCSPDDCRPGEPTPETCNLLDDDCNGIIDDGAPCAAGTACIDGRCQPNGTVGAAGGSGGSSGAGAMSNGAGSTGAASSGGVDGAASGSNSLGGSITGCAPSGCGGSAGTDTSASRGGAPSSANDGATVGCSLTGRSDASAWLAALGFAALLRRSRRRARSPFAGRWLGLE